MEQLTFLKNYKDDEKSRSSLNALMQANLGFTLETWYGQGHWQEQYIPYSFTNGTQIIANVSVYRQDVVYNGEMKIAIRLEHIILCPQYHHKNLIEKLIYQITEEYKEKVDLIYLKVDEAVIPFYPRFGFKYIEEIQHYIKADKDMRGIAPEEVVGEECLIKMAQSPITYSIINEKFSSVNDCFRRSFEYLMEKENKLYYLQKQDTYVIARLKVCELELIDILKEKEIDIDAIIADFKMIHEFDKVKLYNTLQYHGEEEIIEEVGESLVFIKEAPVKEENLFPIIIEA